MEKDRHIKNVKETIQTAMQLSKCRKCGCMKESLEIIKDQLLKDEDNGLLELLSIVEDSIENMEQIEYT